MEEKLRDASLMHYNKSGLTDMVGDNEEFINLLIKTYFDGFYKYLKNIFQAIDDKNQNSLKLNAHSITGSSKSVCFEVMAQIAFELENTDINKTDEIKDLIEEIENEIEIIKEVLNRV